MDEMWGPERGVDCRSQVVPLTVQPALRASCAGNETRAPDNARAVAHKEGLKENNRKDAWQKTVLHKQGIQRFTSEKT